MPKFVPLLFWGGKFIELNDSCTWEMHLWYLNYPFVIEILFNNSFCLSTYCLLLPFFKMTNTPHILNACLYFSCIDFLLNVCKRLDIVLIPFWTSQVLTMFAGALLEKQIVVVCSNLVIISQRLMIVYASGLQPPPYRFSFYLNLIGVTCETYFFQLNMIHLTWTLLVGPISAYWPVTPIHLNCSFFSWCGVHPYFCTLVLWL